MREQIQSDYKQRVLAQKTVWAAGAYDALSALYIERAGFDAVTTSDEETKAKREREQREYEREQERADARSKTFPADRSTTIEQTLPGG